MRALSALTLLGLASGVFAQSPVIGPEQFFQPGQYYLRDNYDPPLPLVEAMIAADGPDYALDLTSLSDGILYGTDSVVCTAAPDVYAYFPTYYDTANVMLTVHDVAMGQFSQYVFLSGPDHVHYVGGQPNGAGGTGNDLVLQRYVDEVFGLVVEEGMAYGYTATGMVDAEWTDLSGSDLHVVAGSVAHLIDGYGSITMPDGEVLPNTLRLRSVMSYTDENDLFGTTTHQDTLYTWYAEGYSGPVMTMARGFYALTSGYVSPLPFTLYHPRAVITGIAGPAADARMLFPNPTSGRLYVRLPAATRSPFHVLDAWGRERLQGRLGGDGALDVSGLPPGTYLLHLPSHIGRPMRFVVAY